MTKYIKGAEFAESQYTQVPDEINLTPIMTMDNHVIEASTINATTFKSESLFKELSILEHPIRLDSGEVNSEEKLVAFFYLLLRDHLPAGAIAAIVAQLENNKEFNFCNGWLADYAKYIAAQLK